MSERAVGNFQQIGCASLDSVGLRQRILQQRTLDVGDIFLHIDTIGQNSSRRDATPHSSRGGSRFCALDRKLGTQLVSGFERNRPPDGTVELPATARPIVSSQV